MLEGGRKKEKVLGEGGRREGGVLGGVLGEGGRREGGVLGGGREQPELTPPTHPQEELAL